MNFAEICSIVQGFCPRPLSDEAAQKLVLENVCLDSRKAGSGGLFICLKGEHTDGHLFAMDAVAAGAQAVLAQHDPFVQHPELSNVPMILCTDPQKALGKLAQAWRMRFQGKVVGITGTAGKTTVKDMLAHVLSMHGTTAKNPQNLNNQLGMPFSMLTAANGEEEFWVMEVGISQANDMEELAPILRPDLALILNVGMGHTQGLGQRGVAWHKTRLLASLAPEGQALINADYADLVRESRSVCPTASYFSCTGRPMPYRASYAGLSAEGKGQYRLWLDGSSLDVSSHISGPYGAEDIIAVAAAAHILGLSVEEIDRGISSAPLPKQRFNRFDCGPWHIVDDSYNANPLSCARMLEAATELALDKSLVCVMGEMLELGHSAESEHEMLGRRLAESKAKIIFWIGAHAEDVLEGLEHERFSGKFIPLQDADAFVDGITSMSIHEGVILFKGSRGNHLERLVQAFCALHCPERPNQENNHVV